MNQFKQSVKTIFSNTFNFYKLSYNFVINITFCLVKFHSWPLIKFDIIS